MNSTFQQRIERWLEICFTAEVGSDPKERTHRFLEEALELAQASGCSRAEAQMLLNYVYSRPPGCAANEVGGALVTLAALCSAIGLDMQGAGEAELARNWDRIGDIRIKRAGKPSGSPLP